MLGLSVKKHKNKQTKNIPFDKQLDYILTSNESLFTKRLSPTMLHPLQKKHSLTDWLTAANRH